MTSEDISPAWIAPFAAQLITIVVAPLIIPKWWSKNWFQWATSFLFSLPVLIYLGLVFEPGKELLVEVGRDYLSFMVLIFSLFVVTGGLVVEARVRPTPFVNAAFLLIGSVAASITGTTGASMVLIRPLLEVNKSREYASHTVMFFTCLVGNIGGVLTPLGDPPLFMGYLAGVPFMWTLKLWPQWLLCVSVLLILYVIVDTVLYRKEAEHQKVVAMKTPVSETATSSIPVTNAQSSFVRLHGIMNIFLLLAMVVAVALVQTFPLREACLLVVAAFSIKTTKKRLREMNEFSYDPILEVCALFFGIFCTMCPAMYILRMHGKDLGVRQPAEFFWFAGMFSSILDNTPTYMIFLELAQSLKLKDEIVGIPEKHLMAIAMGAVFFGANTYIGNAPNLMIKAIAEKNGRKMPTFLAYSAIVLTFLLPLFAIITVMWLL